MTIPPPPPQLVNALLTLVIVLCAVRAVYMLVLR